MNHLEFNKVREHVRQYAFMTARRRKLEKSKDIVLVHIMKEIGSREKLSVPDQKKLAKKSPEYQALLLSIQATQKEESLHQWNILNFFNAAETELLEASLERKNNWNVHNL